MKKIVLILIGVLVLSMTACGAEESVEDSELDLDVSNEAVAKTVEASDSLVEESEEVVDEAIDVESEVAAAEEAVAEETVTEETSESADTEEYQDYIDVEFVDKDGNSVSISDYEGKFIIMNFFGTWCPYCMEELPDFQKVYEEYEDDEFVILLVNATTTESGGKEDAITWYEESGYTMPMVLDLEGVGSSVYPVSGFPTSYFISKEGKVLGGIPGMIDEATILQILEMYNPQ